MPSKGKGKIVIVDYDPIAVVVIGNTDRIEGILKENLALFNPDLTIYNKSTPGWFLPRFKLPKVTAALDAKGIQYYHSSKTTPNPLAKTSPPKPPKPQKQHQDYDSDDDSIPVHVYAARQEARRQAKTAAPKKRTPPKRKTMSPPKKRTPPKKPAWQSSRPQKKSPPKKPAAAANKTEITKTDFNTKVFKEIMLTPNAKGMSLLRSLLAKGYGNVQVFTQNLAVKPVLNNLEYKHPLAVMAFHGHTDVVTHLLDNTATVIYGRPAASGQTQTQFDYTKSIHEAIRAAVAGCHLETLFTIINHRDIQREVPRMISLEFAVIVAMKLKGQKYNQLAVDLIRGGADSVATLEAAVAENNLSAFEYLLNNVNYTKDTPFLKVRVFRPVISSNKPDFLFLLLAKKLDKFTTSDLHEYMKTNVDTACSAQASQGKCDATILKILISHSADVNKDDGYPLIKSMPFGYECAEALLENGAKVDAQGNRALGIVLHEMELRRKKGITARMSDLEDVRDLLLKYGAKVPRSPPPKAKSPPKARPPPKAKTPPKAKSPPKARSPVKTHKLCYDNLNIQASATPAEIKKAYFTMSKVYHPDRCKGPMCVRQFQILLDSYQNLSTKNGKPCQKIPN